MSCLDKLAYHFPEEVAATTVQALIKSAQEPECREDPIKLELVLEALAESSYVVTVADVVLPSLLHQLKAGVDTAVDSSLSSLQELSAYCRCLRRIVEKGISGRASVTPGVPRSPEDLAKFLELVCKKVPTIEDVVNVALQIRRLGNTLKEEFEQVQREIYGVTTEIVRIIMRAADEVTQEEILRSFTGADKNFSQFPVCQNMTLFSKKRKDLSSFLMILTTGTTPRVSCWLLKALSCYTNQKSADAGYLGRSYGSNRKRTRKFCA